MIVCFVLSVLTHNSLQHYLPEVDQLEPLKKLSKLSKTLKWKITRNHMSFLLPMNTTQISYPGWSFMIKQKFFLVMPMEISLWSRPGNNSKTVLPTNLLFQCLLLPMLLPLLLNSKPSMKQLVQNYLFRIYQKNKTSHLRS